MAKASRRRPATKNDARARMKTALAFLEVAKLVLTEDKRDEMPGVSAGLAVLAGIAASDAICANRLGEISRGEDHHSAAEVLRTATADGPKLAKTLAKLIDLKDQAHYGVTIVPMAKAKDAVRWAGLLVSAAQAEIDG